jgi:catechol 2,3-dioxygenase-like lactoylglutathione lyase family enzyme
MTNFGGAAPIFRVANLDASIDYYVNVLGFTIDWEYKRLIASVARVAPQGGPAARPLA